MDAPAQSAYSYPPPQNNAVGDPYQINGPAYPNSPYPGQLFYLTTGTPGIYVYVGGAWSAFISNSIAPPGAH